MWFSLANNLAFGAALGVGVFVAPPLLGFTAAGVAAGSAAAFIQSVCYGAAVPAGSIFAILQSVGATGTIVPAVVAGLGGAASAAGVDALAGDEPQPPDDQGPIVVNDEGGPLPLPPAPGGNGGALAIAPGDEAESDSEDEEGGGEN